MRLVSELPNDTEVKNRKIVYFDNSAIGWFRDNDSIGLIDEIIKVHRPAISQHVIWETGATPDSNKRVQLFAILKRLIPSKLVGIIFEDPFDLITRACMAICEGKNDILVELADEAGEWGFISNPSITNNIKAQEECLKYKDELEVTYNNIYKDIFKHFLTVDKDEKEKDWIKFLSKELTNSINSFTEEIMKDLNLVGKLEEEKMHEAFLDVPILTYWFMSSMRNYFEAIRHVSFPPADRKPPTKIYIDMLQGTYLAPCDYFVTNDKDQLKYIQDILLGVKEHSKFSSLEDDKRVLSIQDFLQNYI